MEAYEYTSLDAAGKQQKGIIQADNEKQARQQLRNRDLVPIQVSQVIERQQHNQTPNSPSSVHNQRTQRVKLKKNELPLLIRQLATLVQAGLPIDDALKTLIEQGESKNSERILSTIH
ncbi:hypothetical protein MNBD_GAMMA02-898, partial [hydrothermal vent metagenome]